MVTGGASGLGAGFVKRFVVEGARVVVIDVDGEDIPGLKAAGNAIGSTFGMTYGGQGGTIGPGLVFGYLSGASAAERVLAASGVGGAS